jgi:alkylation response protein AidB-like acyl-CoA dehydrogenase
LAQTQGFSEDALVRQELALVESGVRSIASNSARALDAVLRGGDPGGVASVNRLVKAEFEQRLHRLAQRLTGSGAVLGSRSVGAIDGGRWTYGYLMTRASTIGAGTAEMQRNTIAEQVLGLPSHRGEGVRPAMVTAGSPLSEPSEDEAALRTVLRDVVSADGAPAPIPAFGANPGDHDAVLWNALVQFGLPGLAVAETLGGGGASMRLLCVAVEQVAFGLASVPLVPTAITLEVARLAHAYDLVQTITDGAPAALVARVGDEGWACDGDLPILRDDMITGTVERVPGAPTASVLMVLARDAVSGELAIASVPAAVAEITEQHPLDITSTMGIVAMIDAPVVVHARGADAEQILRDARPTAQLILGADSVGLAARALAMSVRWAGEREQFGRPIGSFQAVSHKCANMLIEVEGARNQILAAAEADRSDPEEDLRADLAVAAALDAGVHAAEECMQIHGGIGFTWEHPTHLLLRRATSNQVLLGQPDRMRDRAAARLLETAGEQQK